MSNDTQQRYTAFCDALADLSRQYGIIIQSTGGVTPTDINDPQLSSLRYTDDLDSGDILPIDTLS